MKRTFVLLPLLALLIVSLLTSPLLAAEKKKDPLANWKTKFDYSKAEYTYILSNISHPVIQGVAVGYNLRDALWKKSNGRIYVDYRPLAQLGGEKDVIAKLKLGAVQGMLASSVASANIADKLGIVNLPYVVDTFDKLDKFRGDPDLWGPFSNSAQAAGLMVPDITGYGMYGWATTTPVRTLADAKSVNFRIAQAPVNTDLYKAWGNKFTVLPWPDVPQALQTGVSTMRIEVSVMGDTLIKKPTYILSRGSYDAPTDILVKPIALESIMKFDTLTFQGNRLGLAQWTIDKNNPLTARVFVNFMWQEFMGKGIVRSSSDYGLQGDLPSHPELLDWLAVDFMENNWDVKYLIKKIMTSKTYCQSSKMSKKQLEADPENIYYSHAPRVRFKAEIVRDWVLSSSGLLNTDIGGPSVKPYQPKGVWESTTSGRGVLARYKQDHGNLLYRRGLYTFFKLTAPPPGMMIFDASSRDQCETMRTSTNTPLQALTMLNDPTVLEASRVMAENIAIGSKELDEKIEQAFESILLRKPSKFEKNKLLTYCTKQQEYLKTNPELIPSTLNVGEYAHPKSDYNKVEAGALMKTILIIYNLEEAITKS